MCSRMRLLALRIRGRELDLLISWGHPRRPAAVGLLLSWRLQPRQSPLTPASSSRSAAIFACPRISSRSSSRPRIRRATVSTTTHTTWATERTRSCFRSAWGYIPCAIPTTPIQRRGRGPTRWTVRCLAQRHAVFCSRQEGGAPLPFWRCAKASRARTRPGRARRMANVTPTQLTARTCPIRAEPAGSCNRRRHRDSGRADARGPDGRGCGEGLTIPQATVRAIWRRTWQAAGMPSFATGAWVAQTRPRLRAAASGRAGSSGNSRCSNRR